MTIAILPAIDWTLTATDAAPAAVVLGAVAVQRCLWRVTWLAIVVRLPGTLALEACHLLCGQLLGAWPTGVSVWPQRIEGGWRLGQVGFRRLHLFNALPVAIAPLLLLLPAFWAMKHVGTTLDWPDALACLGWTYVSAQCLQSCWPSPTDMAYAWRSLMWFVFLAAVVGISYAGLRGWL